MATPSPETQYRGAVSIRISIAADLRVEELTHVVECQHALVEAARPKQGL
jgi:hypothetical protein